uniref:uncharacterized protein n=1 Tax=Centroberyx gerrardi TaxID=166262 RepID=UPI003AAC7FDB
MNETQGGFYSRYFVVPKKYGGLHPILDLRVLNKYLRRFTFKMLTLRQVMQSVRPGDWFTTVDLKDAYFHVPILPRHRQFLRFAYNGTMYEYQVLPFVNGTWTDEERSWHINLLELYVVYLSLRQFYSMGLLSGQHVVVRSDNTCVIAHINKQGGTCSLPLLSLSHSLLSWSSIHLLSLRVTHIPGKLNSGADLLSRGFPLAREWKLHPEVVEQIWGRFGRATVNLFASRENAHCPMFFSLQDGSAPLGLDALAHQWPQTLLYVLPPVALIQTTLELVRIGRLTMILIAPRWPKKAWFTEIMSLLNGRPWRFPMCRDLLSQAQGQIWHPRPEIWDLWAWPLKGRN